MQTTDERILIVDDQVSFCRHIQAILEKEGYRSKIAHDALQAIEELSSEPFAVLLADIKMPGEMDGLELFRKARNIDPKISCIIMTAYGSISSAVASVKEGVSDYLQKPFEPDSLLMTLQKTLRERRLLQEIHDLRKELDQKYSFAKIIGRNIKMQSIFSLIKRVAPTDASVLISGETGVGKELVAKAIHFNSQRKDKPFVAINCGALTETLLETELFGHEKGAFTGAIRARAGKFEFARGGTIFLDEIGDISPGMQVKLLRVLQEKKIERVGGNQPIDVNVRIISATNQDISEKIRQREFRIDLFYRLNVVPLRIPALRERVEDIPLLIIYFIQNYNKLLGKTVKRISPHAMKRLMEHNWPGNVRELENVLERAIISSDDDTIEQVMFSQEIENRIREGPLDAVNIAIPFAVARSLVLKNFEKAYIFEALKQYDGNVSKTAKNTGINVRSLWRKIKAYGFERTDFKDREQVRT